MRPGHLTASAAILLSLACAHRPVEVATAVPQVTAEVERGDTDFVYTLHLPAPGGGDPWRVQAEDAPEPAVTALPQETLVRWREPRSMYRERPYRFILATGGQRFPLRVDAVQTALWSAGRKTLQVVGGLLTGHFAWPN